MAERKGFEPLKRFPVYTLSKRAPSTTRPPLQISLSIIDHSLHYIFILKYKLLMNISIVIPTFKEKENIKNLINLIKSEIEISKIIVVDDSPSEEIKNEISNFNDVKYIYRGKKLGRGSAIIEGLNFSQENFNSEIFIEMDADLSHDPKELKENLKLL